MMQGVMLVFAVCIDAFFAAFSYGSSKVKINFVPAVIISTIGTAALTVSLLFSNIISSYISQKTSCILGFLILFILGLISVLKEYLKKLLSRSNNRRKVSFCRGGMGFVIEIYMEPAKADKDCSKCISCSESAVLGIALSLDSVAAGIGIGLLGTNIAMVSIMSFLFCMAAIGLGYITGKSVSRSLKHDFSWLSGLILIVIACTKLIRIH
ncbi:MAG: manganese efflux pump [Oscillospiraceae bacterium]|nr:manganese efflux pump [Oscillospiraceae bacterium]